MNEDNFVLNEVLEMPMMALRGITVFPDMTVNFEVERPASVAAVNAASESGREMFLVTQKDVLKEQPQASDIYKIGTICVLRQFIKTQSGGMRVMVEGQRRAHFLGLAETEPYMCAQIAPVEEHESGKLTPKTEALLRQAVSLYGDYMSMSGNVAPETLIALTMRGEPGYVSDYIAQNMYLKFTKKQEVLEKLNPMSRLQLVCKLLAREIEVLSVEQNIGEKLREQMSGIHRDNILREQLRVIQAELGEDDSISEISEYKEKVYALGLEKDIEDKLIKETDRLAKQPFGSAEASVLRAYLDTCLEIPWKKMTKERLNVAAARKILDADHFGLEKVKERIIEYLSVRQLAPDVKGTILCLVGPPGVGKTSVAISIAKATNRKLTRMSLGGVHDESEIRGHRKTYVGSMPGRIINAIIQAKSMNPLMLLDEIDKLGSDYRGDPSAALLEALDPEQNATFRDHFLEIPVDLSNVMFITTANTTSTIPRPLLDRMEVIELTSYTDEEKLQIAKDHLLPKQRKKHGLTAARLKMGDDVLREVIACYTKESGVRQLERELGNICRKAAAKLVSGETKSVKLTTADLEAFLGVRKYMVDKLAHKDQVGVVKGLAWTSVGGEILEVEVNVLEGTGKLELTGNLGDVMRESAKAAVSYIRSRADALGIQRDFYKTKDIHIHFPEGAVPKDGPSAGITMTIAVISALTGAPVRRDVAMTGEITLTGRVLPIGGLKEKTMAAMRSGIRTVIIPADNERDLEEIDQTVRRSLNFVTASHVDNILDVAMDFMGRCKNEKADGEPQSVIHENNSRSGGRVEIRQ